MVGRVEVYRIFCVNRRYRAVYQSSCLVECLGYVNTKWLMLVTNFKNVENTALSLS